MGIKSVVVYFLSIALTILFETGQNQSWANRRTKRKSGREDRNSFLPWSQTPSWHQQLLVSPSVAEISKLRDKW